MSLIGIIGLGRIGTVQALAGLQVIGRRPDWGLAFCSSREEIRGGKWGTAEKNNLGIEVPDNVDVSGMDVYSTPEDLLASPKVKLAVVATKSGLHKQHAIAALRAGKHVLVEKPLAGNTDDADEILAVAAEVGCHVFCGQILPWIGEFQFAYDRMLQSSGSVQTMGWGKLRSYSVFRHVAWDNPLSRPENYESTGGPLLDLGVHDFHLIAAAMGLPDWVQATGQTEEGVIITARTQCYFDTGKFQGANVTVDCGANLRGSLGFRHGFCVGFEGGTLSYGSDGFPLTFRSSKTNVFEKPTLAGGAPGMLGAFTQQLEHAVKVVEGEVTDPLALSGKAARNALAICAAAKSSVLKGGEPVRVVA